MKIGVFTEGNWFGKVIGNSDESLNDIIRTDLAWWIALDATHHPIPTMLGVDNDAYDLGIMILPKNEDMIKHFSNHNVIEIFKSKCKVTSIMQEGPHWYFQDYSMEQQAWFYNSLISVDVIFAHNKSDVEYYKGLTNKNRVYQNKSLMIENNIQPTTKSENRSGVIIGGNFCRWYGGFDSYIVAQEFEEQVYAPSMGRKIKGEEGMPNLKHLPYMNWSDWINNLSQFKYAVHLMPTHAAGTFALNCAYYGIPCIGYDSLDTQELCFPHLTIQMGDLYKARQLAERLKTDKDFYNDCGKVAKENYNKYFSIKKYINDMEKVIGEITNETN
tara:strand:+ start:3649 stop:4635 length:987 start_codon:yes stop_codon:yes gene_type:complete